MNNWQNVAVSMLPELQARIEEAETPMSLWCEIVHAFDEAYDEPRNDDFIERVYRYADWSLQQPEGQTAAEHLPTCVVICFWEHLPTYETARNDMPRWISFEDLIANQQVFRHSLSDREFEELKGLYSDVSASNQPTT